MYKNSRMKEVFTGDYISDFIFCFIFISFIAPESENLLFQSQSHYSVSYVT